MSIVALADLIEEALTGFAVLAVCGVLLLAMRHTMRRCECCSTPAEDESAEDGDELVGDDPDRWRDYNIADEMGSL